MAARRADLADLRRLEQAALRAEKHAAGEFLCGNDRFSRCISACVDGARQHPHPPHPIFSEGGVSPNGRPHRQIYHFRVWFTLRVPFPKKFLEFLEFRPISADLMEVVLMLSGLWRFLTTRAPLGGGSDVAPCGNDLAADDVAAVVLQYAREYGVAGTNGERCDADGLADGSVGVDGSNAVVAPECGAAEPVGDRGLYVGLRRTGDGSTGGICRCAGCGLAHRVRADLKCPFCGGCALPGRKAPVITTTAVVNGVPRTSQTAVREA